MKTKKKETKRKKTLYTIPIKDEYSQENDGNENYARNEERKKN